MTTYPSGFLDADFAGNARRPNLLLKINGVATLYSIGTTYEVDLPRFGDAISFGDVGLLYGVPSSIVASKPYIMSDSALTIGQRVEPEQGRGNTGDITVVLIDKDQEITNLVSPGKVVPDILARECALWYGFQDGDYPEEYFILFRGYITNVVAQAGKIRLTISDATQKKRQATNQAFKSDLLLPMTASDLFVSPSSTGQLTSNYPVTNINGVFDPLIGLYMKIGDEYALMEPSVVANYQAKQLNSIKLLSRGQLGTTAVSHSPLAFNFAGQYLDMRLNGTTFSAIFVGPSDYNLAPVLDPLSMIYILEANMNTAWAGVGGNPAYSFSIRYWTQSTAWSPSGTFTYDFSGNKPNQWKYIIEAKTTDPVLYPISDFRLLFATGPNAASNISAFLGFTGADHVGNYQYESDYYTSLESVAVEQSILLAGHPMDIALTVMLSGTKYTDQLCSGVGTADGITANSYAILLPAGVDAKRDYGLTAGLGSSAEVTKLGDQVTISGSVIPGNNVACIITAIQSGPDNANQVLIVQPAVGTLTLDTSTAIRLAFRSKYDRLPIGFGLKIPMALVDVEQHELLRSVYMTGTGYQLSVNLTAQTVGKEFIESQCYLPFGCYGVTKLGRLSVSITRPPLPGTTIVELNSGNITNPQNITVTRGLNNRRFFNQIQYQYDKGSDGKYYAVYRALDTASLSTFDIQNILPINSDGIQTVVNGVATGSPAVIANVANRLLQRYGSVATEIRLTTTLQVGSIIEAGDIVQIVDDGTLGISNFATGQRDLGSALYEVIDRTLDVKAGSCSLTVLSNVGFLASDRFGTVSPSSLVQLAGSTASKLYLKTSYGSTGVEASKWANYAGMGVVVHDYGWTRQASTVVLGIDPTNANVVLISPALPWVPSENDIVDLVPYDQTSPSANAYSKLLHAFQDPTVAVATAPAAGVVTVGAGDVSKFFVGASIVFFNSTYSSVSAEATVTSIVGTQINYSGAAGWTGALTNKIGLIGFAGDSGAAYRLF